MKALQDSDLMPFGKHKGQPMSKVPADYLHWLWTNRDETHADLVTDYIKRNLAALKKEHPDGIWS